VPIIKSKDFEEPIYENLPLRTNGPPPPLPPRQKEKIVEEQRDLRTPTNYDNNFYTIEQPIIEAERTPGPIDQPDGYLLDNDSVTDSGIDIDEMNNQLHSFDEPINRRKNMSYQDPQERLRAESWDSNTLTRRQRATREDTLTRRSQDDLMYEDTLTRYHRSVEVSETTTSFYRPEHQKDNKYHSWNVSQLQNHMKPIETGDLLDEKPVQGRVRVISPQNDDEEDEDLDLEFQRRAEEYERLQEQKRMQSNQSARVPNSNNQSEYNLRINQSQDSRISPSEQSTDKSSEENEGEIGGWIDTESGKFYTEILL